MSMMITRSHAEAAQSHPGALRFALTILATALLTLFLIPAAALCLSYLAGGAATSTILFVYLSSFLPNGAFLLAALAFTIGALALPRMISQVSTHGHA